MHIPKHIEEQALKKIANHNEVVSDPWILLSDRTRELSDGWLFFAEKRKFLETKNRIFQSLIEFIVTDKGEVVDVPSYMSLEDFLKRYEAGE